MIRVRLRAWATAALAALAWAGCTQSGRVHGLPAAPGAAVGGTLSIAVTEPGSLEPQNAYEPVGAWLQTLMCRPLLELDPGSGRLRSGLATSWLVTDGGQRITVRLRKGLRFSDGTAVTADDVSYSLSRAASADYASNTAALLEPIDGYDLVHGDQDSKHAADRHRLRGISVIDGHSLTITLRRRDADFVRVLATPVAAPVSRRAAERDPDAFARAPVCAGPYRLSGPWSPGDPVLRFERDRFFRPSSRVFTRGGAGYADVIEAHVMASGTDAVAAWRAGTVDVASVPLGQLTAVRDAGTDLVEGPGPYVDFVGFPEGPGSPFADPALRVGLSQALDRNRLAASTFAGGRLPATGFLPPTLGAVARPAACAATVPASPDLDSARAALVPHAELRSLPLKLYFNDDFENRRMVEAVAQQWRDGLGLDVVPTAMPFQDLEARAGKDLDGAFRTGWQGLYPGPDAYVAPLFATSEIGRGDIERYSNARFDRSLERLARSATDEADRTAAYRQLEDILCRDLPLIPVTYSRTRWLIRHSKVGVAGRYPLDVSTGQPLLVELSVTERPGP